MNFLWFIIEIFGEFFLSLNNDLQNIPVECNYSKYPTLYNELIKGRNL